MGHLTLRTWCGNFLVQRTSVKSLLVVADLIEALGLSKEVSNWYFQDKSLTHIVHLFVAVKTSDHLRRSCVA